MYLKPVLPFRRFDSLVCRWGRVTRQFCWRTSLPGLLLLPLGGCAAAPSIYFVGAFFPAWMVSTLLGIAAAIGARATLVLTGLASEVPHQLFVCMGVGAIVGSLSWLLLFGW
jgi:hypothetical protein